MGHGDACNPSPAPGATAGLCPAGQTCAYFDENPSHDLMSFDNVGVAFIALLQAITFDDWTVAMYALMQSLSPYVVVYFLLIVVLGGFFVINLFLAVIFDNFVRAGRRRRKQIHATATEARARWGGQGQPRPRLAQRHRRRLADGEIARFAPSAAAITVR